MININIQSVVKSIISFSDDFFKGSKREIVHYSDNSKIVFVLFNWEIKMERGSFIVCGWLVIQVNLQKLALVVHILSNVQWCLLSFNSSSRSCYCSAHYNLLHFMSTKVRYDYILLTWTVSLTFPSNCAF